MEDTFVELTEGEWKRFAGGARGRNFLQSGEMYGRYRAMGREVYLLGVKRGKKVVMGGMAVAMRKVGKWKIFSVPGGFLGDYGEAEMVRTMTEGCRKFLRGRGGMILQISPNVVARERDIDGEVVPDGEDNTFIYEKLAGMGYKYLGEYEQAKWVYVLSVKGARTEDLYKNFRKGHKLSIRYATERYGVTIRALKYEELAILKTLADMSGEYHGFRAPKVEYFEQMYKAFGKKCKFLVAEMADLETGKKVVCAGGMFVLYGDEVVYLFSGSRREYKKYGGPHLIQWEMIQYAATHGFSRYNFYGVRPVGGDGVYAFKRGFKGQVVELLGTFILPLNMIGKVYAAKQKQVDMRGVE